MPQIITKIKDDLQFVLLQSCFVGQPCTISYKFSTEKYRIPVVLTIIASVLLRLAPAAVTVTFQPFQPQVV